MFQGVIAAARDRPLKLTEAMELPSTASYVTAAYTRHNRAIPLAPPPVALLAPPPGSGAGIPLLPPPTTAPDGGITDRFEPAAAVSPPPPPPAVPTIPPSPPPAASGTTTTTLIGAAPAPTGNPPSIEILNRATVAYTQTQRLAGGAGAPPVLPPQPPSGLATDSTASATDGDPGPAHGRSFGVVGISSLGGAAAGPSALVSFGRGTYLNVLT
jgi:hypothetical protein